jgi:uncharacterized protein with NRDE domain
MCIILGLWQSHPDYPLILIANRDEFHDRPTRSASWWADESEVFGGTDLRAGGSWLGINKGGKLAAVTSFRDARSFKGTEQRSRGLVVRDFLISECTTEVYFQELAEQGEHYDGFNLLAGDVREGLLCWSNRDSALNRIEPGCFGLSTRFFETPWPKVVKAKKLLSEAAAQARASEEESFVEALFEILKDSEQPMDAELPDTGVGPEAERLLSSVFIQSKEYGTRCSTVILHRPDDQLLFCERSYSADAVEQSTVQARFRLP